MIKFLLHGGNTSHKNDLNTAFFKQIANSIPENGLIILNYFARIPTEIKKCFKQDKEAILKASNRKDIKFEIVNKKIQEKQLKKCDLLYLRGGQTSWLVKELSKVENLEKILNGKVVAGSSAGVYVLSKHYCCNGKNEIKNGLGVLNIKARCHYTDTDKDNKKIIPDLLKYGEKNIPLIVIPDYETVVFFK